MIEPLSVSQIRGILSSGKSAGTKSRRKSASGDSRYWRVSAKKLGKGHKVKCRDLTADHDEVFKYVMNRLPWDAVTKRNQEYNGGGIPHGSDHLWTKEVSCG